MNDRRLELFAVRCRDLRDRVAAGRLGFIEAVDMAYSAAVWSAWPMTLATTPCSKSWPWPLAPWSPNSEQRHELG